MELSVGVALIRWSTSFDNDLESQLRVPFLTEKSQVVVPFKQKIQQIAFPAAMEYEDLEGRIYFLKFLIPDYFAVRTMSQVSILTCSRTETKHPSVHHCLELASPLLKDSTSKYIADTAFNSDGSQIATVTDQGYWTVYQVSLKREIADVVSFGSIERSSIDKHRSDWWKMEWTDNSDNLIIASSNSVRFLNVQVSLLNIL